MLEAQQVFSFFPFFNRSQSPEANLNRSEFCIHHRSVKMKMLLTQMVCRSWMLHKQHFKLIKCLDGTLNMGCQYFCWKRLVHWSGLSERYVVSLISLSVKSDSLHVLKCAFSRSYPAFLMGANNFAIDSTDWCFFSLFFFSSAFHERTAHLHLEARGTEMPEWLCILTELLIFTNI